MLASQNRSQITINRYFAALRHILNLAIAEGYLATNPVRCVKFFCEPSGRLRFLSDEEIRRVRNVLTHDDWSIVAFALETGIRQAEQFKARWDCVDLMNGVLTIPLSKSGRTRHVPLSDAAKDILRNSSSVLYSPDPFLS